MVKLAEENGSLNKRDHGLIVNTCYKTENKNVSTMAVIKLQNVKPKQYLLRNKTILWTCSFKKSCSQKSTNNALYYQWKKNGLFKHWH